MTEEQFGAILKKRRKSKQWTQEQLAAQAGLSTRYIQSLEVNDKQPSLETVFKISSAFSTSPGHFLEPLWRSWKSMH